MKIKLIKSDAKWNCETSVTTFPDGMTMVNLLSNNLSADEAKIITSLRSFNEVLQLGQAVDVLRRNGVKFIHLELHYLIGSRMDRPIDRHSPNILKTVCDTINTMGIDKITTVWAHSASTLDRLNAVPDTRQECLFIYNGVVESVRKSLRGQEFDLLLPDSGATKRYWNDHKSVGDGLACRVIECGKHRDMKTGRLSGFTVPCGLRRTAVIVDDLCDGGGTFMGLAEEARKRGAKFIGLVVYHGIFSKGQDLDGIDFVYTSNSFCNNLEPHDDFVIKEVV